MNYSTLRFRYEENKMKCKHWKNNHIGKKSTYYNVDGAGISDNPHAFNFVISKIICPQKH